VKYHPFDSNILASGCLGFEIRVWDVYNRICCNLFLCDSAIISLAFHPHGQYIAIAAGPCLKLWDWTTTANFKTVKQFIPLMDELDLEGVVSRGGGYNRFEKRTRADESRVSRTFKHNRNIRAVVFHPLGHTLFVAAPDQQLVTSTTISSRSL
jgi:WD40 repeat protein